jgi:hypothetical protein
MSNWRRRKYDAPGMSQAPSGPYLAAVARRWTRKIYVTSPGYDNIGEVLNSMGVAFEPFTGEYDCDLLFVNCGTNDRLDQASLQRFVHAGGCLYASDLTSSLIAAAFPEMFHFGGTGKKVLLQLLVLKQISTSSNTTVAQTSRSLGISLTGLKLNTDR